MPRYSTDQIEAIGVRAIESRTLIPGSKLRSNIPIGDKGISYDGDITVFSEGKPTVKTYAGKVPVQVKGESVNKFSSHTRTYSVRMADIINYFKDNGVIYFVVEVKTNGDTKIYFRALLPLDLKAIIDESGKQVSKRITFYHLGEDELYGICKGFLKESGKQSKVLIGAKSLEKDQFKSLSISSLTYNPNKLESSNIWEHEMYLYGVSENVAYPISAIRIESLKQGGKVPITLENESLLYDFEITNSSEGLILTLEQSFQLLMKKQEKKVTFTVKKFRSLESYRKILLMLDFINKNNSISLFNGSITFQDLSWSQNQTAELEQELKDYDQVEQVFQLLNIPSTYTFSKATSSIFHDFSSLISLLIHQDYEQFNIKEPESPQLVNISVGGERVLIWYSAVKSNPIISGFSQEFIDNEVHLVFEETTESYRSSLFVTVEAIELISYANFDLQLLIKSFAPKYHVINEKTSHFTNQFGLSCLNAYDQMEDIRLLTIAGYVFQRLLDSPILKDKNVYLINWLQTEFREKKELTVEQKAQIIDTRDEFNPTDNLMLVVSCNVLLGNPTDALHYYNKMDAELQEEFRGYPIYSLFANTISRTK